MINQGKLNKMTKRQVRKAILKIAKDAVASVEKLLKDNEMRSAEYCVSALAIANDPDSFTLKQQTTDLLAENLFALELNTTPKYELFTKKDLDMASNANVKRAKKQIVHDIVFHIGQVDKYKARYEELYGKKFDDSVLTSK